MMKGFLRFILWLFFLLFTVFILLYTVILSLLDKQTVRDIHDAIPPLATIGSFLGTFDASYRYDDAYIEKKRREKRLQGFLDRKKGQESTSGNRLTLDFKNTEIDLYSPVWTLKGKVSDDVEYLHLFYVHPGRNEEKEYELSLGRQDGDMIHREKEVSLGKETLFNGKNMYIIEAKFSDETIIHKKVVLNVKYERIEVGDKILYLDPDYIPAGNTENILREAENLDGNPVNFVSYGCDPAVHASPILSRQNHQYRSLPACLSFSLQDEYLIWFRFSSKHDNNYYFDIISADKGVLYYTYPLLQQGLNTLYYNLVYRDTESNFLKFVRAKGDALQYALEIQYYDISREKTLLSIAHTNGNQLSVENDKEKILIYLYKEWSNYHALAYPGLRYIFYYDGKQINQGSLYTLPFSLFGPAKEYASTFGFKIKLDDFVLYIDDGIKVISFDTRAIGQTIQIKEDVISSDDADICNTAYVNIYQNKFGKSIKNASFAHHNTFWLAGEGLYASSIKVFHDGKLIPTGVSFYKGRFSLPLSSDNGNLKKGVNIYTIVAYDEHGEKICSIEKEVEIP